MPRAEVSTDLAMIDLMNRQPEQALDALNNSRTTLLPNAMAAQRRVIEARAWLGLSQYDHALEIIQGDKGADTDAIRAEVAWKKHDWSRRRLKPSSKSCLATRYKAPGPLNPQEEARLLRAAIAFSLAGDQTSLGRLRDRYNTFVAQAQQPDALRVALSSADQTRPPVNDFTRVSAENDSFAGWVQAMKQSFRDRPAPTSPTSGLSLPPAGAAPTQTAQAAPAAPAKATPTKATRPKSAPAKTAAASASQG